MESNCPPPTPLSHTLLFLSLSPHSPLSFPSSLPSLSSSSLSLLTPLALARLGIKSTEGNLHLSVRSVILILSVLLPRRHRDLNRPIGEPRDPRL